NLARSFDRNLFIWIVAEHMIEETKTLRFLSAHQQSIGSLFDDDFTTGKRIFTIRSPQYINVSRLCIRCFNFNGAVDSLHLNLRSRLKLKTLANLVADFTLGII